jgi:hypothetical protein
VIEKRRLPNSCRLFKLAEEIPFAKFQLYIDRYCPLSWYLIGTNQIIVEDFRELVQTIARLAMEFEVTKRIGDRDYILSID